MSALERSNAVEEHEDLRRRLRSSRTPARRRTRPTPAASGHVDSRSPSAGRDSRRDGRRARLPPASAPHGSRCVADERRLVGERPAPTARRTRRRQALDRGGETRAGARAETPRCASSRREMKGLTRRPRPARACRSAAPERDAPPTPRAAAASGCMPQPDVAPDHCTHARAASTAAPGARTVIRLSGLPAERHDGRGRP